MKLSCWILNCLMILTANGFAQTNSDTTEFGQVKNYRATLSPQAVSSLAMVWQQEVGEGRSQIVGTKGRIFVATGSDQRDNDQVEIETQIRCLDVSDGKPLWEWKISGNKHEQQENFSGAPYSPQSTPLLLSDRLLTTTFDGQLVCLDSKQGKLIWKKDLVRDFGADPVQFGFSSSPVLDRDDAARCFIQAQGKDGGLYCINPQDGTTYWKAANASFSYSTPVQAKFGGVEQVITVTRDEVSGIGKASGRQLWRYELPKPGLTNVPTPLVVDNQTLLISGQGCGGTRCLQITQTNDGFDIAEKWFNRQLPFFYSNWALMRDGQVIGCLEKFLVTFKPQDGTLTGRWRGFTDANLLMTENEIFVLDGKGHLNKLVQQPTGFSQESKFKMLDARCWTPLSVVDGRLFVRGGNSLICLLPDESKPLENLLSQPKILSYRERLP